MANIVIGTAGHVDHGKTTLIKALTGIETDTTKEEKKRGMSINLGFAYLDLTHGRRVGIVDVPGHEKFIKNMVAGLPGINLVLLVIDAGEGVMPQTREHIDILSLLGVKNFLIVLTKIDTVDEELRELAVEDIREQLADTALKDAEIVETDAISGKGISELRNKIEEWADKVPEAAEDGKARLNVDRVFSVKGFGTVVTGTLLDGPVSVGDELTVYPGKKKTRIRNIQVHETDVKRVTSRHRTALNLANITTDDIERGDVLSVSDQLQPTWMLDVKISCLKHAAAPVGLWDRVRLLIGTREVMARAVPIGTERIEPGQEGFLQLRLETEQVVVKERDRFILRTYSPMHTIAGGEILDAAPKKHRRFKADVLASLKTKEEGNLADIMEDFLIHKKQSFTTEKDLAEYTDMTGEELQSELTALSDAGKLLHISLGYIHTDVYKKIKGQAVQILLSYHQKFPLRAGMSPEEFRSRLRQKSGDKTVSDKEISALIKLLLSDGACKEEGSLIAAASFTVKFNEKQTALRKKIEETVLKSGYTPVKKAEFYSLDQEAEGVVEALCGSSFVQLTPEYVISGEYFNKAVQAIHDYIREHGRMALGDFRDITDSSRKSSMLILEYADSLDITRRVENYRVLGSYWNRQQ